MIVYLDASALVKCYAAEAASLATIDLIDTAGIVVTSAITRVEVASALARGVRVGAVAPAAAEQAYRAFERESPALIQVPVTDRVLSRAQAFVWDLGLRGYDAVQLASAATWQERMGGEMTFATFDLRLARAARGVGLAAWPAAASS